MQKIDVAISSYKKPESLIYTLFSLKKHCGDLIDTVYINDDCSGDGVIDFYKDETFQEAILPIKIKIRENKKRVGYGKFVFTYGFVPKTLEQLELCTKALFRRQLHSKNDIRYQWAIESTDKKYLFIVHDDIKFLDNILKLYFETIQKNENCAVVGDLGQCWICLDSDKCNPENILQGKRPHKYWPLTTSDKGDLPKFYQRCCRINEWCCLINVDIAKKISKKEQCYFGNYQDLGDIAAYWFCQIVKLGYDFVDPLPLVQDRAQYYRHCWQGHSGHSVWENQGSGLVKYSQNMIKNALKEEFDYDCAQ